MNRRSFLAGCAASLAFAGAAQAKSYGDRVVDQLRSQGYSQITVERTLLGRIRIVATRGSGQREIIINPRTGEILRDLWIAGADGADDILISDGNGGQGGGHGGGDDDNDDGGDDNGGGGNGGDDGGGDDGGDDGGGGHGGGDDGGGKGGGGDGGGGGGDGGGKGGDGGKDK